MNNETSISRERAKAILESIGAGDAYCDGADYWIVTDGNYEYLWVDGDDTPLATNHGTISWDCFPY